MPTRLSVGHLEDRTVPSTFKVSNLADAGPGSLRAAVAAANAHPGTDAIAFVHSARGTIVLTTGELGISDGLRIDGPGAGRLAISGNDASRVFNIAGGVAVSIDDLTVTHGRGLLRGGGILNDGTLTLSHAVVSDNEVVGLPGANPGVDAFGGGILNRGTLTVSHTRFVGNRSTGGDGDPTIAGGTGGAALGGAIMSIGTASAPATATVSRSEFFNNRAVGGAAAAGATSTRNGLGGAIMNDSGTFTISHSLFQENRAVGGYGGGAVSFGSGGAIQNAAFVGSATLAVSHSTFLGNRAVGGAAVAGNAPQSGQGGAITNFIPGFAPPSTTVVATVTIAHSTFLGNEAIGGAGTVGGTGRGGALANLNRGIMTVSHSLIALNRAVGGAGSGGNGGNGQGGGIFNGGPIPLGAPRLALLHSLVALNRADGGSAVGGVAGTGQGGGIYVTPGGVAAADRRTLVVANAATTADDDVFGTLGEL